MQLFLLLINILLLFSLFYQDMKERQMSVILLTGFILTAIAYFALQHIHYNLGLVKLSMIQVLMSCFFLAFQLLVVLIWIRIKDKNRSVSLNEYLGYGDIVFLFIATFYFSFLHYILFFVFGIMFSLLLYFGFRLINKWNHETTIPLAGFFSVFLILILVASYLQDYNLYNNESIKGIILRW